MKKETNGWVVEFVTHQQNGICRFVYRLSSVVDKREPMWLDIIVITGAF